MPKLKDRHGSSKKKKEFSSHADMKPTPDQSKSNEHLDLPASSQGHPLTAAAHTSFVVSANWKNLAKQLGLDSSCRRREKTTDGGRSKAESSKNNSKFISSRKRKKMVVEAPQPKRRKSDDTRMERVGNEVPEQLHQQHSKSTEAKLITGRDNRCLWTHHSTSGSSAGRCVSLDCEMVGTGPAGDFSMLARCSIVNHHGNVLYDSYVAPMDKITDYRTKFSGITAQHLRGACDFKNVQKEVSELIKGRVLVGHAIHHDLKALLLSHPRRDVRDTSKFKKFRQLSKGKAPSLKKLAKKILNIDIQQDHHDSIEDARVAMRLYQLHKGEWEAVIKAKKRIARGHGCGVDKCSDSKRSHHKLLLS